MQKWIFVFLLILNSYLSSGQSGNKETLNECKEELFPFQDRSSRLWGYKNFMGATKIDAGFLKAYKFEGPYAIVETHKGKAIINCEGFQAIPTDYDEFAEVCFGRLWARKSDKWGFLDMQNKTLQLFEYSEIKPVRERSLYLWAKKKDKWGLHFKETNKFLTPFAFDAVSPISDSASLVRKGNYFALLAHQNGNIIQDSMLAPYRFAADYLVFEKKGRKGAFSDMGRVIINPIYDSLNYQKPLFLAKVKDKWGAIKTDGSPLLPVEFDSLGTFSEGHITTAKGGKIRFYNAKGLPSNNLSFENATKVYRGQSIVQTNTGFGILDLRTGKYSLQPEYKQISQSADGYIIAASAKPHQWQLLSYLGKSLCNKILDSICIADSAAQMRMSYGGQWFYVKMAPVPTKTIIIPEKRYRGLSAFNRGFAIIEDSAGKGVINKAGTVLVPPLYEAIEFIDLAGTPYFKNRFKGSWGLLNARGETLIAPKFQELIVTPMRVIKAKHQGFWGLYSMEGKPLGDAKIPYMEKEPLLGMHLPVPVGNEQKQFGLLDYRGQLIIPFKYDSLIFCGLNVFKGKQVNSYLLHDLRGNRLGNLSFKEVGLFQDGIAPAFDGQNWGFVNNQGNWLYPPKFEAVTEYRGRSAIVKVNGKWGAVDRSGNFIQQPIFSGFKILPSGAKQLY